MSTKENTNATQNGNTFTISGDWTKQSNELKEKYSQLTDSDLKFVLGKENELIERVATKLNKKRDEVINIIKKVQPAQN